MKDLTKAEEQVMQHLWDLQKAYLKDIVDNYPNPKPAYTTVSTVVNVLVKKGFIGFNTHGKAREYFPLISKQNYSSYSFRGFMNKFFNDSPEQFASFFTSENDLSVHELQEIEKLIKKEIKKKKDE